MKSVSENKKRARGMKVITTDKFNDREYISIFGICIYYCRELDDGYKKRFLCFRWFKRKNTIERKIDSILNELQKIGSKGKMSKLAAETDFENLPFEEIQKNSVLLIESNNFHSETLPGIARYFIDLGYNVDILLSYYENKLNPFDRYRFKKIRIKPIQNFDIRKVLKDSRLKKYAAVFFNSDRVNYQKDDSYQYFKESAIDEKKKIYMLHHPEAFQATNTNRCMLGNFDFIGETPPAIIVPTYYGNVKIKPKNEITSFVVIGNIDQKRKNFDLLLKTITQLKSQNIDNFKINVIARVGQLEIPEAIKKHIAFKGKLTYSEMYCEIENADFILALLDSSIPEHRRYLTKGISGTILLSYGFRKPCIVEKEFANQYGFTNKNSLIYSNKIDFHDALIKAINIDKTQYLNLQCELSELVNDISDQSKKNLSKFVPNIRG